MLAEYDAASQERGVYANDAQGGWLAEYDAAGQERGIYANDAQGGGLAYEVPTGPDAVAQEDYAALPRAPAARGFTRSGSLYAGFGSAQQDQQTAPGTLRYDSVLTRPGEASSGAGVLGGYEQGQSASVSAAGSDGDAGGSTGNGGGGGRGRGKGIKRSERQGSILHGFDDTEAEA